MATNILSQWLLICLETVSKDLKVGDTITRLQALMPMGEYNGKWYTNISAWAVEVGQARAPIGENDP